MEFMLSERGSKLIVINNFTFRKDRVQSTCTKYRCTNKLCKASIRVDHNETILLESLNEHNHDGNENLKIKVRYFDLIIQYFIFF